MSEAEVYDRGKFGNGKSAVLLQVLIGLGSGVVFYLLFAVLLLHKVIGSQFESEPFLCRVMSDPINMFSIAAFTTAMALLIGRWFELRNENRAFEIDFLPGDPQGLILPEDALACRQQLNALPEPERGLLRNRLLAAAVQRSRANWSAEDAATAVSTQAEIIQGETDAEYSMIKYLAWAIPSIGFIGTVLGIGQAMGSIGATNVEEGRTPIEVAAGYLNVAFDTTFVALILSLVLMYFVHRVQADEEGLLVRATDWCMKWFVLRMHIPKEH